MNGITSWYRGIQQVATWPFLHKGMIKKGNQIGW